MQKFLETYQKINATNLDILQDIYTPNVHFVDPAHEIHGLSQLTTYFYNLYEDITSIDFEFSHPIRLEQEGYVQWFMRFRHLKIKGGQEITVPGATFLRFAPDTKAFFHRDYFDLGNMIYQHLPFLGKILTLINRRFGS